MTRVYHDSEYLASFRQLAGSLLDLDQAEKIIRKARATAGGRAASAKRKAANAVVKGDEEGEEPAEFSEYLKGRRLFTEVADVTGWFQIVPGPGLHKHAKYGSVVITKDTIGDYVNNFKNRVYQEHIPIDAEHQTKLSGALGYYRDMKEGHEGEPGVWAQVELNERGKTLSKAFKYFSPEMWDEWTDPATETTYKNVIVGGAFTNRPFFKDKSLAPIQLSEFAENSDDGLDAFDVLRDLQAMGFSEIEIANIIRNVAPSREETEMTEDTKSFAEQLAAETEKREALEAQLKAFSEKNAAAEAAIKTMNEQRETEAKAYTERIEAMEREQRTRRFTELVTGRGGESDGLHFFGEPEKHVTMLETLAKAFGEDSEPFKDYVAQQSAMAKTLKESRAFQEEGSSGDGSAEGDGDADKVESEVEAYLKEHKDATKTEAYRHVMTGKGAKRYTEYNAENVRKGSAKTT